MTKKKQKPDLTINVMSQIKSGQVKMKPKLHFVIGSIMTGFGVASSLLATLPITMMIFFRIRKFGLVGLTWPGRPLFAPMPVLVLGLSLLILAGGIKLLKRYDFAYKHNFVAIVIAIITLILTLGFMFDRMGANERLREHPKFRKYYQQHQPGFSPRPKGQSPRGPKQF